MTVPFPPHLDPENREHLKEFAQTILDEYPGWKISVTVPVDPIP